MTGRELLGVLGLNALYLLAGGAVLAAGLRSVREIARLAGVAYLVGVSAVLTISVELLIVFGVRPGVVPSVVIAAVITTVGCIARATHPPAGEPKPRVRPALSLPSIVGASFFGITLFMLVHLLRLAYTQGLSAWDAWSFWTPKALAIHFDGLDPGWFGTISAHTYPLIVPVTDASVFAFAGGTDPVPLSMQFFLFFVGFVAAAAGLSARMGARGWAIWSLLASLVVLPAGLGRLLAPQGDFLLDYFFAIAVGLFLLWLRRRESWSLIGGVLLLVGAATTKREGIAFVLALSVVIALSAWRSRRGWVVAVSAVAIPAAAQLPWWLWLRHHGITAESSGAVVEGGGIAGQVANKPHLLLPALGAVIRATFSTSWWGVAGIGGCAAVAWGIFKRETRSVFALVAGLSALLVVIFVWRLLWGGEGSGTAFETAAFPTRRLTGALVLAWITIGPVLLTKAAGPLSAFAVFAGRARPGGAYVAAFIPAVVLLVWSVQRGDFASVSQRCHVLSVPGAFGVVLGPEATYHVARVFQRRVTALGFQHTILAADVCGGIAVVTPNLPTFEVAQSVQVEAQSAHLNASIVGGTG